MNPVPPTVGILHPGAMGVTVARTCGAPVVWCSDGRSTGSRRRADEAGLDDAVTMAELVARSDVIVSVCPPDRATEVAEQVAGHRFDGVFVDANAIAPSTSRAIAGLFEHYVDGGIIGPPADRPGTTRMYLAGERAASVSELWSDSDLDVRVIDGAPGSASALKMVYATWTKVTSALLLDVRALARAEGVEEVLLAEWSLSQPGTDERSAATARGVAPKAWRFSGEMQQIAETFEAAALPTGFAVGAAEVYRRLAGLRTRPDADLDVVLAELLDQPD